MGWGGEYICTKSGMRLGWGGEYGCMESRMQLRWEQDEAGMGSEAGWIWECGWCLVLELFRIPAWPLRAGKPSYPDTASSPWPPSTSHLLPVPHQPWEHPHLQSPFGTKHSLCTSQAHPSSFRTRQRGGSECWQFSLSYKSHNHDIAE